MKFCLNFFGRARPSSSPAPKDPGWHDVPGELLCLFARKLGLSDRITLSLVCKSWRSRKDLYILSSHELPLLVLPHLPSNRFDLRMLSLSRGAIESFRLSRLFRSACYIGCSNGWLIFEDCRIDEFEKNNFHIFLFNPISGRILPLPRLAKTWKPVSNVTVSSSQVSETLMVAAIIKRGSRFVVCRQRDFMWSYFVASPLIVKKAKHPRVIHDLLFHGDTLFVLTTIFTLDVTYARGDHVDHFKRWTFGENCTKFGTYTLKLACIGVVDPLRVVHRDRYYRGSVHLVLSTEGELMMVLRRNNVRWGQGHRRVIRSSTKDIFIYRVSFCRNGLSLGLVHEIGDQVLFIGHAHPMMLSSKTLDGARRNCVIFTNNGYRWKRGEEEIIHGGCGVFNLETKRVESLVCDPYYVDWFLPSCG